MKDEQEQSTHFEAGRLLGRLPFVKGLAENKITSRHHKQQERAT